MTANIADQEVAVWLHPVLAVLEKCRCFIDHGINILSCWYEEGNHVVVFQDFIDLSFRVGSACVAWLVLVFFPAEQHDGYVQGGFKERGFRLLALAAQLSHDLFDGFENHCVALVAVLDPVSGKLGACSFK